MWRKLDETSTIDSKKVKSQVKFHWIICTYVAKIKLDRKWL